MSPFYFTVKQKAENEIDIKKSSFIANVAPVSSEKEAQQFIAKVSEQHKKATHNCSAYLIGINKQTAHASDNGEPSGTAGIPILDAIKLKHLTNVCVVITRYFGGIKLGAGGLIRAYSNAATEGIAKAGIEKREERTKFMITLSYKNNEKLKFFLSENNLPLLNSEYGEKVITTTAVPSAELTIVKEKIKNIFSGNVELKTGSVAYFITKSD